MWIATYWMCINWQTTKLRSSVVPDDVPVDSTVRTHFSGPTSCGGAVFVGMWRGFFLCPLFIIYIHLYCDVLPGQHVHSTSHMFFHCSRQDPPPSPSPHTHTPSHDCTYYTQDQNQATNPTLPTSFCLFFSFSCSLALFFAGSPLLSLFFSPSLFHNFAIPLFFNVHLSPTLSTLQCRIKVTSILIFYSGWRHNESSMMCWSCLLPTGSVVIRI